MQEVQVDAIDIQLMLIGVLHEVHLADYKYAYLVQIIRQDPILHSWSAFTDYYANVTLQASRALTVLELLGKEGGLVHSSTSIGII